MHVRLKVKLAEKVEGVDLSHCAEGDVVELADADAMLLIRGEWAEQVSGDEQITCVPRLSPDIAADRPRRRTRQFHSTEMSVGFSKPNPEHIPEQSLWIL